MSVSTLIDLDGTKGDAFKPLVSRPAKSGGAEVVIRRRMAQRSTIMRVTGLSVSLVVLGCAGSGHSLTDKESGVSGVSGGTSSPQVVGGVSAPTATNRAGQAGNSAEIQRAPANWAGQGGSATEQPRSSAADGGATAPESAAGGGGTPASMEAGAGGTEAQDTGVLPAVTGLDTLGPFQPMVVNGTGPNGGYRLDHPEPLAGEGLRHPVVVFAAGGGFPENYETLLRYVASHGFVALTYAATSDDGQGVIDGIDWLVEQGQAVSGMLAGKIDVQHIAAAGHSFGSLAVFNAAPDPRITTTVHLQGGTLEPHKEVEKLRAPSLFVCGETPTGNQDGTFAGDMANLNCAKDFELATTPVFYGSLKGAAHIQLTESVPTPDDPLRMQMLGVIGGWLRWWLAGDQSLRPRYIGADCDLCQPDTGWTIKQKGLM